MHMPQARGAASTVVLAQRVSKLGVLQEGLPDHKARLTWEHPGRAERGKLHEEQLTTEVKDEGQGEAVLQPTHTGYSLSDELDGILVLHPALDEGERHKHWSPEGTGRAAFT